MEIDSVGSLVWPSISVPDSAGDGLHFIQQTILEDRASAESSTDGLVENLQGSKVRKGIRFDVDRE